MMTSVLWHTYTLVIEKKETLGWINAPQKSTTARDELQLLAILNESYIKMPVGT